MGIWLLIGNIMLLLFGFVVFLVLSCVVYVVYIVCKALFKALFFARKTNKGPDKNGNLCVPEGIESIDECTFDDCLMYQLPAGQSPGVPVDTKGV